MNDPKTFETLLEIMCCPKTRSALVFHRFGDERFDGLLVCEDKKHLYPVLGGVPIMLPEAVPEEFANTYRTQIVALGVDVDKHLERGATRWSFSDQWKHFDNLGVEKTWGWTTENRVDMFFQETQTTREELKEAIVLDAGCGNGLLTEALGTHAKLVIGIDFADSVFADAERNRKANVFFLKGDLQNPPFKNGTLNVIVSNGVLHHTPSTRNAFNALAPCVADGGAFYIWLYRDSAHGNIFRRALRKTVMGARVVVAPLPKPLRTPLVHAFAGGLVVWNKLKGDGDKYSYSELFVNAHDSLTPKYRTNHTATEVAEWYFESGFGPPVLTHWDNRTGFGVVARKIPADSTPGVNFGAPRGTVKRYGV